MLKAITSIAATLISLNALAQQPSEASIESLFEVMNSKQLVEDSLVKIDTTLQSSLNRSLKGKPATAYQIGIVKQAKDDISALIHNQLSWQNMKPVFIQSYQKTFSQDEINGILEFYQTDAGKALLNKLPTAINTSVELMESQLKDMSPEIDKIRQTAIDKIKGVRANPDLEIGKGINNEKARSAHH